MSTVTTAPVRRGHPITATPLRLLILEDNPSDAELVLHALRRSGYDPTAERVETEADFRAHLSPALEVILADFSMPEFDALRALTILQESGRDIPFIIVSGTIGEERAVEVMRAGAADYIIKDRMGRLGQAVAHALDKKARRDETRLAERRMGAEHAATRVLAESRDLDAAVPRVFEAVCASMGWAWAAAWMAAPGGGCLRLAHYWHAPSADAGGFLAACREKTFAPGEGLPGRVWSTGEPLWLADVMRDEGFFGKHAAAAAGLHAAFAFPVLLGREVVGVIEFLSRRIEQPDEKVLGMMAAVGSQLGQFIERKRKEDALRRGEERFHELTAHLHQVLWIMDAVESKVLYVSPGYEKVWGRTCESLLDNPHTYLDGIHPLDQEMMTRESAVMMRTGSIDIECRVLRPDGSVRWIWIKGYPVAEHGRVVRVAGVVEDVTERKSLEEQFRQSQKMDAFGQLAGGVAHDFNNLLTIISGYSAMLLDSPRLDDRSRGQVMEIHTAGSRAALLTGQLLAFSRRQVVQPRVLDLNAVVADTEQMLGRLIGEDVTLATVPAPGLDRVKADAGQVEQVILNLVVNARDAMPRGGRITIETANVDLDEVYAQGHAGVVPGRYVRLAVTDTGAGMTDEVKARIFEPFFTTKGPGKGTGLGLATVFGIVKQSGGHVGVTSEVGRGTTFEIYFPAVAEMAPPPPSAARPMPLASGTETILIAEDETALRVMTRLALQKNGYTVLEAADGEEALRLGERHPGPIDLLVSDVVMPRMGGRQLAERLTALRPEMRVMFVSGYTDDAVVRHGVRHAEVAFLQKPFSPDALCRKVRAVLDGEG